MLETTSIETKPPNKFKLKITCIPNQSLSILVDCCFLTYSFLQFLTICRIVTCTKRSRHLYSSTYLLTKVPIFANSPSNIERTMRIGIFSMDIRIDRFCFWNKNVFFELTLLRNFKGSLWYVSMEIWSYCRLGSRFFVKDFFKELGLRTLQQTI